MQPDATLTKKQERAVLALLTEPGVDAAAKAVGVNPSTLWRWLQDDNFKAAVAAARREAFGAATSRIAASCTEAAETLRMIAIDPEAPPAARVSAAKAILEKAAAAIELEDLTIRIDALEKIEAERSAK
ncbi:MAG TPA: hypothetical protein VHR86_04935 [Armatimonadota bacterium]|nr:hypothetical protein [Armatimonadota bacterium]